MIETVAHLLNELKNREVKTLQKYHMVNHPTIIGSMYENLTKDILQKTLFKNVDLRVAAGKIRNESTGNLSLEVDCMIVFGDGDLIPYTDKHIYNSRQVIAIIEVKKNLFSKELKNSYESLRDIQSTIDIESRQHELYHVLHQQAYKAVCNDNLYSDEALGNLPIQQQMIYHAIALEAYLPLRIVWGYDGFSTEYSLRESFVKYMENVIPVNGIKKGVSPFTSPSLIICNQFSLVKTNGIPFAGPVTKDYVWTIYGSSNENPVYYFLEILWTKLHFMFNISYEIFGPDMRLDSLHRFLDCSPHIYVEDNTEVLGWNWLYKGFSSLELKKQLNHMPYEPIFLTKTQYNIILEMSLRGSIYVDEKFNEEVTKFGYTLESFINSLTSTGLFYFRENEIQALYDIMLLGQTTDGKYFIDENSTGKVDRWLKGKKTEFLINFIFK